MPTSRTGTSGLIGAIKPLITSVRWDQTSIRQRLRVSGYSDIVFVGRDASGGTVRACRVGKRFLLQLNRRGRVRSRTRTGRCGGRPVATGLGLPQIRRALRAGGYSKIRFIDRVLPRYVAQACKRGKFYRLNVNRNGVITGRKTVGRCTTVDRVPPHMQPGSSGRRGYNVQRPAAIRADLRSRGFNRIIFTDRVLPIYVVRACKRGRRMELRINGKGRIRNRQRIGRCEAVSEAMKPPQVRRVLETRGFSRITFTDHQLPVYVAEACRRDRKYELRLNRFARVQRKTDIGPCRVRKVRHSYSPSRVRDILQRRGYDEIEFFDRDLPRYGVTACKRGQKFRMHLNRFAEIRHRRRTGFCRPPRVAPPVVNNYEEIDDSEIDASGRIDPETCQNYLDALVHRNRIHFDVASAVVRARSHRLLRRLSRVMNRCPDSRIEIAGHTDSDGSRESNHHLSHERAHSVARFLYREGISRDRISAKGYGEEQPLVPYERSDRDRARNRRIEFTVIWGDDGDMGMGSGSGTYGDNNSDSGGVDNYR
ncbi:MAG: OmpA family protein [Hyphomicrobiaceae bacterium]|nr:OmpA family protein [Hyphomicrobiaceae bacterium]